VDPGFAVSARQGDRYRRWGALPLLSVAGGHMTVIDLGVPSMGPAAPAPTTGPLVDTFGRIATDLRVSLTDRCNLRCTYCMPAEGLDWMPRDDVLTDREVVRLIRIAVGELGIKEVRFTGGEPLLRRGLESIVGAVSQIR